MTEEARKRWQRKLDHLLAEEAIVSSAVQKFELSEQIAECRAKLAELDEEDRRRTVTGADGELAEARACAGHGLGRGSDVAALLEAAQREGLMLLAVPRDATGTTVVLSGAAADSTPLPDTVLADSLSGQIAKDFARIRERYLSGDRAAAIAELDALLADRAWPHLTASLRGRLLRAAALYQLDFGQDQAKAEELAECAAAEDPSGDDQTLAAHLALRRGDRKAALELLGVPRSPQARHLKAAILIEAGDAQVALDILAAPPEPADGGGTDAPSEIDRAHAAGNTAETRRLRGLAHLALKQLPDAAQAIDLARALAPDWIGVRGAARVIDFWRACTPAALTLTDQPLWPVPFARALVREGSGERLAEVAGTFAAVAAAMPAGSYEQMHWLTWRLVALITAGANRDEASALARQLLAADGPLPLWPLMWALFHGLDLDRDELKRRLAAVPGDDPNAVLFRGLYLEMRLEDGEAEQVLADLPELARLPIERGLAELPRQWKVAALTTAGQLDDAERIADEVGDERLRLRLRLSIAREREQEQPGSHKAAAAALFAVDPGADVLAEACEAHAAAGDWAFVAEHADELLEAIPTPGSLRLLAIAAFNRGEYRRCLGALDHNRDVYPDGRLPQDLALLRMRCQRALGDLTSAIRDARMLVDECPTAQHLVELMNAQLEAADSSGMRESLHRLALIEPADSHLLVQGARFAAPLDQDLASLLWQRAVPGDVDDAALAAQAAMLGETLGLAAEQTGPWFRRMGELAQSGSGPVQMLHVSELPRIIREQREATQYRLQKLGQGEVPVHVLLESGHGILPGLFHAEPKHNRAVPDPLRQQPIPIRHGARPLGAPKAKLDRRPRLILDLTALITARSLGLLDRVEQAFSPLWLHRKWHLVLQAEIERLRPSQPARSENRARIGQLVQCGAITLVDTNTLPAPDQALAALVGDSVAQEIEWAHSNRGALLTYLPLHHPDIEHWQEVDLPIPWQAVVIGPRALLDGLLAEGLIDEGLHEKALADFPAEPDAENGTTLHPRNAVLLSNPTLLGQFAELSLLNALSHRFRLHLTTNDWQREQQEAESNQHRAELVRWTEALIERVSCGLDAGHYRLLPATRSEPPDSIAEYAGLGELLSLDGEPGDLLWVDDRFMTSYPSTGTMPVIGVVEVLDLLRAHRSITPPEWFDWLYRLRGSNARFVPLAADEILHWLRQAHSDSDRLIVPLQLEVMSRYWAACVCEQDFLQWTGNERHQQGEVPFFIMSQSEVTKVLTAIWADERLNARRRRQRADWVLDNLYVGVGDIPHLGAAPSPERDMSLVGMDQAGLCFGAFQVMFERIERNGKRKNQSWTDGGRARERALTGAKEYLQWICERIVTSRLRADPDSLAATAAAFRSLLLGSFARRNHELLPVFGSWLLKFLPVLPPALCEELHKDQDLMQRLGIEVTEVVEINGLHFRAADLGRAVQSALRLATPILQERTQNRAFSLRLISPEDAARPVLELGESDGKPIGRHYFEYSELLFDSREKRLAALQANPHWSDGAPDGIEAVERQLAVIDSPHQRLLEAKRIASSSADAHYLTLESAWRQEHNFTLDRCFPPPLAAVLNYIRCGTLPHPAVPDRETIWQALVDTLPSERGLGEAIGRMTLFPSALPEGARQALRRLQAGEIARLLDRASGARCDPMGRVHVLDLALAVADLCPAAIEIAQAQVNHLASEQFAAEVETLTRLADMAYRAFDNEPAAADTPPALRLLAAWVHAARVAGILLRGGADTAQLADLQARSTPFPFRDLYGANAEPHVDLAWPWHVEPAHLAVVAVGGVLNRHPTAAEHVDTSALRERLDQLRVSSPRSFTDLHLLHAVELQTDVLHCLWGGDRSLALAPLCEADYSAAFSPAVNAERINGLVAELEATPEVADHWQALWIHTGPGQLPDDLAERLAAVVEGLDLDALLAQGPPMLVPLLELAVRYATDRERIAAWLLDQIERLDMPDAPPPLQGQAGEGAIPRLPERLVHWLHQLALRHPDDPDAELARLLEIGIHRSRTFASHLRPMLIGMLRFLPYSRHRALRRTLLAAKASAAPPHGQEP